MFRCIKIHRFYSISLQPSKWMKGIELRGEKADYWDNFYYDFPQTWSQPFPIESWLWEIFLCVSMVLCMILWSWAAIKRVNVWYLGSRNDVGVSEGSQIVVVLSTLLNKHINIYFIEEVSVLVDFSLRVLGDVYFKIVQKCLSILTWAWLLNISGRN